jgi:glycerol-3-phosphate dehydrogenase (NAD(P)+)
MTTHVTILGGGAMATACAILLARQPQQRVTIWARNPVFAAEMAACRENQRLLPGIKLPDAVRVTADLAEALSTVDLLVASIPTQFLRGSLTAVQTLLPRPVPVVSVAKGIENGTFLRPTQILCEVLHPPQWAALSGPSHAEEIGRGQPATVVAASPDLDFAKRVQAAFHTDRFRVYTNRDLVGVELAGALKNVIAIAAGICDGLGYGDNAKSALMTRGLVEMTRFGLHFGAEPATFSGLAGMGDLITTCISPFGRNRQVGVRLGRGESLAEILATMTAVAEGVATTRSVYDIAVQAGIDLPITSEIYQVLFHEKPPGEATAALMLRPLKGE